MNLIYRLPFYILEVPNLKLKRPSWFVKPSAMAVFSAVLLSYFLMTGGLFIIMILFNHSHPTLIFEYTFQCILGIIYDVILEPPSVGSTTDEHGHSRPVSLFDKYFLNIQICTNYCSYC